MAEQIILRRQRDDEMASAAVIQRALLPRVKEFADESRLDVWASMTPARDIGGDFFDLVPLADGRVALGVGDVCGKGVPAALFMGITRMLIRINLRENPDLSAAIVKANAFLASTARRLCARRAHSPGEELRASAKPAANINARRAC